MVAEETDKQVFECACGDRIDPVGITQHERGKPHQDWEEKQTAPDTPPPAAEEDPGLDPAPEPEEVPTEPQGINCEHCGAGPFFSMEQAQNHMAGDAHREIARAQRVEEQTSYRTVMIEKAEKAGLSPDLKATVLGFDLSHKERARIVRAAFAARGWPNDSHPGKVLDFLKEWDIPFTLTPHSQPIGEVPGVSVSN